MKYFLWLLFFFKLWSIELIGQPKSFNPKNSLEDISISQWTTTQGLPSNNTNAVFQDSKGLIWIASNNGLMIYDGERIETYDKNSLDFLENDGFYHIVEDHNNTIFIASKGDGIIKYESGAFKPYQPKGIQLPKSIRVLFLASDSSLFLGSNSDGLYRVKNDSVAKITDKRFDNSIIQAITEDRLGNIWFGIEGKGLNTFDGQSVSEISNHLERDDVLSLKSNQNKLFIGTSKGLYWKESEGDLHTVEALNNTYINSLLIDDWGMLWVGSEAGVARWNPETDQVEWLRSKHNIDLVRITSLMMDEENHIWLSSNRSGLIQIKESNVSNFASPDLSSDRINLIHESWDGNLYIGTDANQIDIYDGQNFKVMPIKTNLNGNGVRDILHDNDGSFWLATYIGIIHISNGKETLYSTTTGMPANNFRVILKDRHGFLWFGTRSGGLIKFRNKKIVQVYSDENGLESNFVFSIAQSKKGEIYVGTFGGGLTIIDEKGKTNTYHLNEDDSGLLLFNIDFDENQNALITSNNGPLQFSKGGFKEIKLKTDQRSRTFFDLVIGDYDHLWLSTNLGVLQIRKQDWNAYLEGSINTVPYFLVDQSSGMNTEECTGATRSNKISNGNILIPTLGGVVAINPQSFKRDQFMPRVLIRQMVTDEKVMNISEETVECAPGTSRYRFDFSVLSYTSPDRNQFKYKLEGYDSNWSQVSTEGTVEYTNLPPGGYTFKVIGSNDGYLWNEKGDSLSFQVKPFYYQTLWFLFFCILIITISIILFFKWRVSFINNQNKELRKVNAELDRFVYSASHEMRSPLSSILGLINIAVLDESTNKKEYLDYIKHSVERLDSLLRDIVDHSKNARLDVEIEPIDLKKQVDEILQDISYLDNYSKIKHQLDCPVQLNFHSDAKRLKIVISNLITNAFKHHAPDDCENPYVDIKIVKINEGIKIKISDNGPGIAKEEQGKIFNMFYRATHKSEGTGLGLYLVKEIVENLKGSIELQSDTNQGTTFIIDLPDLS